MDTYLVRLRPVSPYLTPWRNCTLWGRLAWIVQSGHLPGWDIARWVGLTPEGLPPVIVGDAFPVDAVPVPAKFRQGSTRAHKDFKVLPWDSWQALCASGVWPKLDQPTPTPRIERMHVSMNRSSGSSMEGGLRTEIGSQPKELLVVVQSNEMDQTGLELLFQELCIEGWGANRSSGYGQLQFESVEAIARPADTGWIVALGHVHPTDDLPEQGYWQWTGVPVRPHDAQSRQGRQDYFATMLGPGASFPTNAHHIGRTIEWEGRKDYRHFGIAPTWPVTVSSKSP